MSKEIERIIAQTFLDMAQALETGGGAKRPRIALTVPGSELGEDNVVKGALMAADKGVDVICIGAGQTDDRLRYIAAADETEAHTVMENLLESREADGAVTMHYPFPIGVSTVGRLVTPARGNTIYLSGTTGTSSTDRIEAMIKNAVHGIIAAKACGVKNPTVGILNVDGARQAEAALKRLMDNGYPIRFAESKRADGGCILRGNDVLTGEADVVVTDSLTGNIIVKMLSAFSSGGNYEAVGWGYGPGIGEANEKLILIISRASGSPVICGALEYAAELVKGDWRRAAEEEFKAAYKAGLKEILQSRKASDAQVPAAGAEPPPREVVTFSLSGIEIMDLDDAIKSLWAAGIYAESGMGCTGPIILVSEANGQRAANCLKEAGYLGK